MIDKNPPCGACMYLTKNKIPAARRIVRWYDMQACLVNSLHCLAVEHVMDWFSGTVPSAILKGSVPRTTLWRSLVAQDTGGETSAFSHRLLRACSPARSQQKVHYIGCEFTGIMLCLSFGVGPHLWISDLFFLEDCHYSLCERSIGHR